MLADQLSIRGTHFSEIRIEIVSCIWNFRLPKWRPFHYDDVIMGTIASQITSLTSVYSTVYSGADQSKHHSSASLAFVWGIHRGPVNSPHKRWIPRTNGQLRGKCFHLMTSSCCPMRAELNNKCAIFSILQCFISSVFQMQWLLDKIPQDPSQQVMAWCRQATSHFPNQCYPNPMPIITPSNGNIFRIMSLCARNATGGFPS